MTTYRWLNGAAIVSALLAITVPIFKGSLFALFHSALFTVRFPQHFIYGVA